MNEFFRKVLFLPLQRSTVARDVDFLHYFVISVTMAGSTLVFLAAAVLVVRYRRPAHDTSRTHRPEGTRRLTFVFEIGMLVLLMVLFLSWWVVGSRLFVRIRVPPQNTLDVYVTGKQWMWKFAYPNGKRSIAELYVPAHRPIKLIMTSRDVIHSFFIPDFRIKQDVVPGRYMTLWFEATAPGRYQILCAEYCGTSHSTMRGEVVVLEPTDYERWLEDRPSSEASRASFVDEGRRAASELGCLRCHTTDGSPHIGPTWAGLYGTTVPLASGDQVLADDAYMTESMMDPTAKVVRGYVPVMPSFFGRMRPPETAAILELIKSLRDVPRQGPGGQDPGPARLDDTVLP